MHLLAPPASPWSRGTDETTDGLLGQYAECESYGRDLVTGTPVEEIGCSTADALELCEGDLVEITTAGGTVRAGGPG